MRVRPRRCNGISLELTQVALHGKLFKIIMLCGILWRFRAQASENVDQYAAYLAGIHRQRLGPLLLLRELLRNLDVIRRCHQRMLHAGTLATTALAGHAEFKLHLTIARPTILITIIANLISLPGPVPTWLGCGSFVYPNFTATTGLYHGMASITLQSSR